MERAWQHVKHCPVIAAVFQKMKFMRSYVSAGRDGQAWLPAGMHTDDGACWDVQLCVWPLCFILCCVTARGGGGQFGGEVSPHPIGPAA
jgi:hypothetical protein